jgi:hypothetical protein
VSVQQLPRTPRDPNESDSLFTPLQMGCGIVLFLAMLVGIFILFISWLNRSSFDVPLDVHHATFWAVVIGFTLVLIRLQFPLRVR